MVRHWDDRSEIIKNIGQNSYLKTIFYNYRVIHQGIIKVIFYSLTPYGGWVKFCAQFNFFSEDNDELESDRSIGFGGGMCENRIFS